MKTKYSMALIWGLYFFFLAPPAHAQYSDGTDYGYDPGESDFKIEDRIANRWIGKIVDTKLNFFKEFIKARLNCHRLGTIVTFDSTTQTATVRLSYKVWEADLDPNYHKNWLDYKIPNSLKGKLVDYPLLVKVPVFVPAGGNAALTMPVKSGDSCLVVFSDFNIKEWLFIGKISNIVPLSGPEPSIRDAFAIVGFRPMTNPIRNYNATDVELRNADAKIIVGADGKVSIKNDKESLHDVLTELVECMKGLTVRETSTTNDTTKEKLKEIQAKLDTLLK